MKSFPTAPLLGGLLLTLLLSGPSWAQYGGGGSGAPSYGNGKAVAAGIGAAGAAAAVLYFTLHRKGSLTGCVQGSDAAWTLVDEKKHRTYSLLLDSAGLTAGERVELRGKRSKDEKGTETFQVSKIVKHLGACNAESAASASHSGGFPSKSAED